MVDLGGLSRRRFLHLTGAAGASLVLPQTGLVTAARAATLPPLKEEDLVIAFGHVGPIADEGWTWSHHQGMKAVEAAFPKARTLFVENIPFSADANRTFRQFVSEGANMVFSSSYYGDFLHDVAKQNPEVVFYECDGRVNTDNLSTYYIAHWYASYVAGVAAGLMTKSNKLGYVGSFPVPTAFCGSNSFLMGARSVNPKATMQVVVINSWFDPQAATQAGTALVDNGCDVLFGVMDEAGYLQVAEKRGVKAVMFNTDIRRYGPNAYITSIVHDFTKFYVNEVKSRLDGTWSAKQTLLPLGGGSDRDAWGQTVPAEIAEQADKVREKLLGGWSPFVGPIKDNKGNLKVADGHQMTDDELYNWDWSMEGVTGF